MSKASPAATSGASVLYRRIRDILESARRGAARSVNSAQVVANWLIGREIVEEEQRGKARAEYGKRLLENLARRLKREFGAGYSTRNLWLMRQFYLEYPPRMGAQGLLHAARGDSTEFTNRVRGSLRCKKEILQTLSAESGNRGSRRRSVSPCLAAEPAPLPGALSPDLSWSHYSLLLRVVDPSARGFYEIEAVRNAWSARELERQIASLLFERLARSRDKRGVMRLARRGHVVQQPADLLVDLKIGKLTHADIGQMELYTAFFDEERRPPGDGPTLGLMLCTDKNDAMVRYMLGKRHGRTMFASRYRLHLPTEAELRAEVRKSLDQLEDRRPLGISLGEAQVRGAPSC